MFQHMKYSDVLLLSQVTKLCKFGLLFSASYCDPVQANITMAFGRRLRCTDRKVIGLLYIRKVIGFPISTSSKTPV